jgi:hypothetical protein
MTFVLDANVLVNAHCGFLRRDLSPGFWHWLEAAFRSGTIICVDKIKNEPDGYEGELKRWCSSAPKGFFRKGDLFLLPHLAAVNAWAQGDDRFSQAAKDRFADDPDSYLIAHARLLNGTVVTYEKDRVERENIKIPVACRGVGVQCVTFYEMFKLVNVTLAVNDGTSYHD